MSRRKRNEDSSSEDSDDSHTKKYNKKKNTYHEKKDYYRTEHKKYEDDVEYKKTNEKQQATAQQQYSNEEQVDFEDEQQRDRVCLPYDKSSRLFNDRDSNLYLNIRFRHGKIESIDAYHWNNKIQQYQRVILRDKDEYKAKITGKNKSEKEENKKPSQADEDTEERFVYEETSQLYYEKKTGLYYDPNSGLYYNYNTYPATCFHHAFGSNTYLPVLEHEVLTYANYEREPSFGNDEDDEMETKEQDPSQYLLVVEYLDANGETQTIQHIIGNAVYCYSNPEGEMANGESSDPYTTVVTIGRHKTNDVALPDLLVSKYHALIIWESVFFKSYFWLMDVGSKHGTYLNGTRISAERTPSEKQFVKCGDVISIGNAKATVHPLPVEMQIKRPEPEPPQVENNDNSRIPVRRSRSSSRQAYLEEKRKLKSKWQLTKEEKKHREYLSTNYTDRAAVRREINPDTEPFKSVADFDLQSYEPGTSLNAHLPDNNIGFILLQKLGWKKGDSLGRAQDGIKEPIAPATTSRRQGLGYL